MRTLKTFLFASLFFTVQSLAADVRLDVLHVKAPDAVSRKIARRLQNHTVKYFRSYKIPLHRGWLRQHKDLYPNRVFAEAYDFIFEFRFWIDRLHELGWLVDGRAVNVVSPTFIFGGFSGWIAGVAGVGSILGGGYSLSHASNQTPNKFRLSLNAMRHEVAHVLGAEHISDRINLMHPGSGIWVITGRKLPLDPVSIQQIRETLSFLD